MELKNILHNEIYYYTNVFENADEIISMIEDFDSIPESYPVIKQWKRDNSDRMIKHFSPWEEDLWKQVPNGPLKDKMRKVIDTIFAGINRVSAEFYKNKGIDNQPNIMPALHICKYEKGGNIGYHFDAERNRALLYTVAIYWNDNYSGGELGFQLANVKRSDLESTPDDQKTIFNIKPEKGSVIIFPAAKPYFHSSLELKEGIKYFTGSAIYVDGFDPYNSEHTKKYYTIDPDE